MKKKLFAILLLVLTLAAAVSCGEAKNDDPNTVTLKTIDNLSEYVIVRGDSSSSDVTALATSLRKAINDATGASVSVKTDAYNNSYEILIGETKRQQSIDAHADLRYYDYAVKLVGNKIVVAGGSAEALSNAIDLFKNQFIDAEKKTVKVPSGAGYTYKANYKFDKITVDGTDLGEFDIYYNGSTLLVDGKLPFLDTIRTTFGVAMGIENKTMLDDTHYVVIDNTGLIADEYSIEISDGNIYIKGSYNTIDEAMDYFVNDFFGDGGSVEKKSGDSSEVMSIGKKEMYTREQAMKVLEMAYEDDNACIIGQQADGGAEMISATIADFVAGSGQKPGIIGIDLAVYGVQLPYLAREKWSQLVCEITDYCADGGLITASSHWANPSDPEQYVRGYLDAENETKEQCEESFRQMVTPGTEYNEFWVKELDINAEFLKALKDNGVVMIWRPLHEMNGNWFWYCVTQQNGITVDAQCLIDMWVYCYEYYTNEWGLDNLIWCYGPNTSGNVADEPGKTMSPMYCYPGDEYVDIVGVDWYTGGNLEVTSNDNYLLMIDETKKVGALTEFGPSGAARADSYEKQPDYYSTEDLIIDLWTLKEEGYKFAYLLTWTRGCFVTVGAMGGETGGYDFMNEEYTLGQADVKAMFDSLK